MRIGPRIEPRSGVLNASLQLPASPQLRPSSTPCARVLAPSFLAARSRGDEMTLPSSSKPNATRRECVPLRESAPRSKNCQMKELSEVLVTRRTSKSRLHCQPAMTTAGCLSPESETRRWSARAPGSPLRAQLPRRSQSSLGRSAQSLQIRSCLLSHCHGWQAIRRADSYARWSS